MLMHCLCTMFVRRFNFSLRPQAAYAAPYAALMQGLCTDQAYARLMQGLCGPYAGRKRERQTHRAPATDKHRQRETESNRVAHRALCKPLMRISLSQNLSCCLCAAWFLLSGAVFWLMRAYALPTWFKESLMQCLCGLFFDSLFLIKYSKTITPHMIPALHKVK